MLLGSYRGAGRMGSQAVKRKQYKTEEFFNTCMSLGIFMYLFTTFLASTLLFFWLFLSSVWIFYLL